MKSEPITTHCMGKSVPPIWLPFKPRNVLTIRFHFRASEVSPPATIKPVAGHMTQRKVAGKYCSGGNPHPRRESGMVNTPVAGANDRARQIVKATNTLDHN